MFFIIIEPSLYKKCATNEQAATMVYMYVYDYKQKKEEERRKYRNKTGGSEKE